MVITKRGLVATGIAGLDGFSGLAALGETATLDIGGGYVGTPVVSTSDNGYVGVSTVNAPPIPLMDQIGFWIKTNPLLAGGIFLGLVLVMKRR